MLTVIDAVVCGGAGVLGALEPTLELIGDEAHPASSKTHKAQNDRSRVSGRAPCRTHRGGFKARDLRLNAAEDTPLLR